MQPNFLGLGAQKCASSWIHKILEDHPDVFVSQPKELDFFTNYFNRGYTWYERHFNGAGSAKAIGEVSPSYFCDPLAPERIRRYRDVPRFLLDSLLIRRQVRFTTGALGVGLKAYPLRREFLTLSAWSDRGAIRDLVRAEPHASAIWPLSARVHEPFGQSIP